MIYKLYGPHIIQQHNIYKIVITVLIINTTKAIYEEEDLLRTPNGKMTNKDNLELSQDHFLRVPII